MITLPWRDIAGCSVSDIEEEERMEQWVYDCYEKKGEELYILEIGSFHGRSTTMLAQFGYVIAIDLWSNVDVGLQSYDTIGQQHFIPFIQNMIRLKLVERVHPVVSTSKFLENMLCMSFDVIYIDASHFYEDVKLDIERSKGHLKVGGLFIFDDYLRPGYGTAPFDQSQDDPWSGVAKAVDELLIDVSYEVREHFKGKIVIRKIA